MLTEQEKENLMSVLDGSLFEFNNLEMRQKSDALATKKLLETRGMNDFRIVCDETNNTEEVVNSGGAILDVYVPIENGEEELFRIEVIKTKKL